MSCGYFQTIFIPNSPKLRPLLVFENGLLPTFVLKNAPKLEMIFVLSPEKVGFCPLLKPQNGQHKSLNHAGLRAQSPLCPLFLLI
ncbi:MAG: hypothetical protein ACLUD1_04895 [Clostridia bacterium]